MTHETQSGTMCRHGVNGNCLSCYNEILEKQVHCNETQKEAIGFHPDGSVSVPRNIKRTKVKMKRVNKGNIIAEGSIKYEVQEEWMDRFDKEYERLVGDKYGSCQECGLGQKGNDIKPFISQEIQKAEERGVVAGTSKVVESYVYDAGFEEGKQQERKRIIDIIEKETRKAMREISKMSFHESVQVEEHGIRIINAI